MIFLIETFGSIDHTGGSCFCSQIVIDSFSTLVGARGYNIFRRLVVWIELRRAIVCDC